MIGISLHSRSGGIPPPRLYRAAAGRRSPRRAGARRRRREPRSPLAVATTSKPASRSTTFSARSICSSSSQISTRSPAMAADVIRGVRTDVGERGLLSRSRHEGGAFLRPLSRGWIDSLVRFHFFSGGSSTCGSCCYPSAPPPPCGRKRHRAPRAHEPARRRRRRALSLQALSALSATWRVSAHDRSSEDTRYTQREQAEAAAERAMRSRGGRRCSCSTPLASCSR